MSKTPSNESDKNIKTGTPIQKNLEAIAPTNKDHNNQDDLPKGERMSVAEAIEGHRKMLSKYTKKEK